MCASDASDLFSAGARLINYSAESTNAAPSQLQLGLLIFTLGSSAYFFFIVFSMNKDHDCCSFLLLSSLQSIAPRRLSHKRLIPQGGSGVFNPLCLFIALGCGAAAVNYWPAVLRAHAGLSMPSACNLSHKTSRFSDKNGLAFLAIHFPH
jgi:hypothetical protein